MRTLLPLTSLLLLPLLPPPPMSTAAGPSFEGELSRLVPDQALIYVEVPGLADFLEQGLEHPLVERLLETDVAQALVAETGQSPEQLLAFGEAFLGVPPLETAASLLAHGFAVASRPGDEHRWLLVARGDDSLLWEQSLQLGLRLAADGAGFSGAFERPAETLRGADVWHVGDDLHLALRDSVFLASGKRDLLVDSLDLLDGHGASLADREGFALGRAQAGADELAWMWVDVDGLEHETGGLDDLRRMARQPEVQFLLGPGLALMGQAGVATASLDLDERGMRLRLDARGIADVPARVLLPETAAAPEAPRLVRDVPGASALLYRDAAGIFEHRAELFPAEQLPGFSKAISDLSLFLGGLDLAEDVLPGLDPWIRVVARPVEFAGGAEPEIPLPAACALIDVRDPERLGQTLVGAFQSAVGIINVERAQQAMDPMVLRLELVDGTQVTYAEFLKPGPEDGVDMRYNLVPACALRGSTLVVGTHMALVEEMLHALPPDGAAREASGAPREELLVDGAALADALALNLETLAMAKVLEEGVTLEEARGELHAVHELLGLIDAARVDLRYGDANALELTLDLEFTRAPASPVGERDGKRARQQ